MSSVVSWFQRRSGKPSCVKLSVFVHQWQIILCAIRTCWCWCIPKDS